MVNRGFRRLMRYGLVAGCASFLAAGLWMVNSEIRATGSALIRLLPASPATGSIAPEPAGSPYLSDRDDFVRAGGLSLPGARQSVAEEGRELVARAGADRVGAEVSLAVLYLSGQLGRADVVEAGKWIEVAAEAGNPYALYLRMRMREEGQIAETEKSVLRDAARLVELASDDPELGPRVSALMARLLAASGGTPVPEAADSVKTDTALPPVVAPEPPAAGTTDGLANDLVAGILEGDSSSLAAAEFEPATIDFGAPAATREAPEDADTSSDSGAAPSLSGRNEPGEAIASNGIGVGETMNGPDDDEDGVSRAEAAGDTAPSEIARSSGHLTEAGQIQAEQDWAGERPDDAVAQDSARDAPQSAEHVATQEIVLEPEPITAPASAEASMYQAEGAGRAASEAGQSAADAEKSSPDSPSDDLADHAAEDHEETGPGRAEARDDPAGEVIEAQAMQDRRLEAIDAARAAEEARQAAIAARADAARADAARAGAARADAAPLHEDVDTVNAEGASGDGGRGGVDEDTSARAEQTLASEGSAVEARGPSIADADDSRSGLIAGVGPSDEEKRRLAEMVQATRGAELDRATHVDREEPDPQSPMSEPVTPGSLADMTDFQRMVAMAQAQRESEMAGDSPAQDGVEPSSGDIMVNSAGQTLVEIPQSGRPSAAALQQLAMARSGEGPDMAPSAVPGGALLVARSSDPSLLLRRFHQIADDQEEVMAGLEPDVRQVLTDDGMTFVLAIYGFSDRQQMQRVCDIFSLNRCQAQP